MPRCSRFAYTTDGSANDGLTWEVYSQTTLTLEECGKTDLNEMIVLDAFEYTELAVMANYQEFDTEAYHLGYDSVLSSWAIGIGIGLILAMIAKLKR